MPHPQGRPHVHPMKAGIRSVLPFEWVALSALVLTLIAQTALPSGLRLPFFLKMNFLGTVPSFMELLLALAALLALKHFASAGKGRRIAAVGRGLGDSVFGSTTFWIDALRILLALWIVLACHFVIKTSIHMINPKVFDLWLWRYDAILGFGHDPVLLLLKVVHQSWLLHSLDVIYSTLYPILFLVYPPLLVAAMPARTGRIAFATAFCLLWVVGGLLYVSFPSWGPVFIHPHFFERTLQSMPVTVYVQSELFQELKGVLYNPLGARSIRFGGVAAFPSLHLAVISLFTAASRKVNRYWFAFNLAVAVAMFFGSLLTGYHYLFDSLAGVAMGLICYHFSRRWAERALAAPAPATGGE